MSQFASVGLQLSVTYSSTVLRPNDEFSFTMIVSNSGSATARTVLLANTLPPGVAPVSVTVMRGAVSILDEAIICRFGNLASNAFASVGPALDSLDDSKFDSLEALE